MKKLLLALLMLVAPLAFGQAKDFNNALNDHLKAKTTFPEKWKGKKLEAKVQVKLDKAGKVTAMILSQSSGMKEFDEQVLQVVSKAQPFPAPPETVVNQPIEMVFKPD